MTFRVRLMAFGGPGEVRLVDVPDERLNEAAWEDDAKCDLVFYYGQNDFQPRPRPSVSVGDVVEVGDSLWLVLPAGFARMTPDQFAEYERVDRRDRSLYAYQFPGGEQ